MPFEGGDEAAEPKARPPRTWLQWGLRAGRLLGRDGQQFAPLEVACHLKRTASLFSLAAMLRLLPRQDWWSVDVHLASFLGTAKDPQAAANWDSARLACCCVESSLRWVGSRLLAYLMDR